MSKTLILALASLATVATAASPAMAHGWARNHPRQAEVLGREHHQIHRINQERREGELTGQQARALRSGDRAIAREDHADAHANGGHITRQQKRQMNRQLNAQSHAIGR